jgi:hypothetical protein
MAEQTWLERYESLPHDIDLATVEASTQFCTELFDAAEQAGIDGDAALHMLWTPAYFEVGNTWVHEIARFLGTTIECGPIEQRDGHDVQVVRLVR